MRGKMKKILIVDDEEKVRKLVEVTLSVGDVEIFNAATGEEALNRVQEVRPDVILLDVMMPGPLDGYDVCRLIKQDPATKGIYIIMLTAWGQQADKERGLALGADDYFVKPFSPMELMDRIDHILA